MYSNRNFYCYYCTAVTQHIFKVNQLIKTNELKLYSANNTLYNLFSKNCNMQ